MRFELRAVKSGGEVIEEVRESVDKETLLEELKAAGLSLISLEEVPERRFSQRAFWRMIQPIRAHDKIIFARNLGAMLEAGLPLARSLSVMERQTKNVKLRDVLAEIQDGIKKGAAFSETLRSFPKIFSSLFVAMVKVGEESGNLANSLKAIGRQMEAVYLLMRKVKGALIYPAVIVSAMVIIGVLLFIYVVPTLTSTFRELGAELPLSTRVIIAVSDFVQTHGVLALAVIIVLIGALVFAARRPKVRELFGALILKSPVIGYMIKEANSARTARTLSSLIAAGVDVVLAFEITADVVSNARYRAVLVEAKDSIKRGAPIAAVFARHERLYPPFVAEMISVGEETGKLSEMLDGVASFYEGEVEQRTKDLSTIIEPALMIFIGAAVGFFAVSMIMPIYSMVSAF